ncbi:hypothetical protein BXO88_10950 [Oribacterium sp. C9]|uniref:topoisomerase DNA-binding C4 zinc finger domain-containing protein n=1 Tax=Oribacterium sp. C9 TaxID=1943579 RepID=UPI00098ED1C3|nr:topoisomerase DNA-binding C4 zinc finger domain-containing protein [Oribacterium sp. C9]OON85766.1 hypothetical protein BXO88_10950 [Oribacterium sp. C9]
MVQRSVALCDGELIGIESIYNIINGKPIYKKGEVEALREKGRQGKLLCPCGCGAKLILAAGELRLAHFKIHNDQNNLPCHWIDEGEESIDSKLVLKNWLETELGTTVQSRIPINNVSDSDRRFEYTFLSSSKEIALSYTHKEENLSDEKLNVLFRNSNFKVILFTNQNDNKVDWQYHEWLMKIQNRQGYCLLLDTRDVKNDVANYEKAIVKAIFYDDIQGTWRENCLAEDYLKDFHINSVGDILIHKESLKTLLDNKRNELILEAQRRKEEYEKRRKWEELQKKREDETRRKRDEEQRKILEEQEKEYLRKKKLMEEQLFKEQQAEEIRLQKLKENFKKTIAEELEGSGGLVYDPDGNRWLKCKYCGKIDTEVAFQSWQGNFGTCKDCFDALPPEEIFQKPRVSEKPYDPTICPECGGKLRLRTNRLRGTQFYGCSNYPNCRYTRSV